MNFNRKYVWFLVILILGGFFYGYMVLKTQDTTDKTGSVHNHSVTRTSNTRESDERLQIGQYVAGFNLSLIGKEFNFNSSDLAFVKAVLRDQTFKRKPVESINAKTPFFDLVAPVTGCSSNHYGEFKHHIKDFTKQFPGIKWFFYDLGLNDAEINEVRIMPDVVYRKFNFDAYPQHIRNLHNYGWKILIIQQMLSEFDGTMWFDSSVKFTGNQTNVLIELMSRHNTGAVFYVSTTGHSIITATHPTMLEYLPMEKVGAVKDMLQGGAVVYVNKDEVQRRVMKWLVICVLKEDCISPPGSTLYCGFNFPRDRFGGCHRYDQSLQNILISNAYNYEQEKYYYWSGSFAIVER